MTAFETRLQLKSGEFTLHVEGGHLTIVSPDGDVLLETSAAVELGGGRRYSTDTAAAEGQETPAGAEVRATGDHTRPELLWHIMPGEEGQALFLRLEVTNTTGGDLQIERLDPLEALAGFCRSAMCGLEVSQTGWQSWSPAYGAVAPTHDMHQAGPPVLGPVLPPCDVLRVAVPWVTVVHAPGGRSLLAGFVTARDQTSVVAVQAEGDGHSILASSYAEGVTLRPGATLRSETLMLVFDRDDTHALDSYARRVAAEMQAREWPTVPAGWCSWYYYFTAVTEADIMSNLETLAAARDRLPLEYVQIDDGYQASIGDWLTINEKFPRGMRFLADTIRSQGFKPGIWFAPFLVSEASEVYRQHPDWVLRDEQGDPVNAMSNWGTRNFALDITTPQAADWLRHVVSTIVNDWGYEYLKIDFIYAEMIKGVRYEPNLTSVQAYRRGLELIREVAGDRFILGCGAPFLPSVGMVDGMRIGPDVAPYWRDPKDHHGTEPAMFNAIRSTLAHGWMHRRLWVNDPDCLMVREHDSQLTLAEVRTWVTVAAMSGGMVLFSDNMSKLEPSRASLLPFALPTYGEAAEPHGPYVSGAATHLALRVRRDWENWLVTAMFNWHDEALPLDFDPSVYALAEGESYHLFDPWTEEHTGPVSGPVSMGITAPHGTRLVAMHSDLGRPQVVGTTLHVLAGAVEIAHETWERDSLTLELDCQGVHDGHLAIYVPEGYELLSTWYSERGYYWRGRVLLIPVHLAGKAMVKLDFTRDMELTL